MEYLIIRHLSSPVGARLNKFYCISTWNCFMCLLDFSHMEIIIYFHLLCNSLQANHTNIIIIIIIIIAKRFQPQQMICFNWAEILTSQKKNDISGHWLHVSANRHTHTHRTHPLWFRLYTRKSYHFWNPLLLYAYICLFVSSCGTHFCYIYIFLNFYVAGIT